MGWRDTIEDVPQATSGWRSTIEDVAPQQKSNSLLEGAAQAALTVGAAKRALTNPFGFGDELSGLAGGIAGAVTGDGFAKGREQALKQYEDEGKILEALVPNTKTAFDVVAAGMSPDPLYKLKAASIAGKVGLGAGQGAIQGGLFGLGNGEGGIIDRAGNAAESAGIGGGIGGAIAGVMGIPAAAATGLRKLTGVNPEAVAALERVGIKPTLGAVTDSPAIKTAQNMLSRYPGSSGVITKSVEDANNAVTKQLDELGMDKALTRQKAGEVIKSGVTRGVERGKELHSKLYDIFESHVAKDTPVDVTNTNKALSELNADIPGAPELSKWFKNGKIQGIEGALKIDTSSGMPIELIKVGSNPHPYDAIFNPGGTQAIKIPGTESGGNTLPYEAIKKLRTLVGKQINEPSLLDDVPRSKWKTLYGALSDDLRGTAEKSGPRALKAFNKSNELYSKFVKNTDDNLQAMLKKTKPEEVFRALKQGTELGGTKANAIMGMLNKKEREIMRGSLFKQLGKVRGKSEFNALKAVTAFDDLAPEAQAAFFKGAPSNLTAQYKKLSDGVKILQGVKEYGNPSGSGYMTNLGMYFGAGGVGAFTADNPLEGAIKGAGLMASTAGSARLTAKLMTSPSFVKWLAKGVDVSRGSEKSVGAHIKALARITKESPEIADDVQSYLISIGASKAGDAERN